MEPVSIPLLTTNTLSCRRPSGTLLRSDLETILLPSRNTYSLLRGNETGGLRPPRDLDIKGGSGMSWRCITPACLEHEPLSARPPCATVRSLDAPCAPRKFVCWNMTAGNVIPYQLARGSIRDAILSEVERRFSKGRAAAVRA